MIKIKHEIGKNNYNIGIKFIRIDSEGYCKFKVTIENVEFEYSVGAWHFNNINNIPEEYEEELSNKINDFLIYIYLDYVANSYPNAENFNKLFNLEEKSYLEDLYNNYL